MSYVLISRYYCDAPHENEEIPFIEFWDIPFSQYSQQMYTAGWTFTHTIPIRHLCPKHSALEMVQS